MYIDGDLMVVLPCGERDSRDRCLHDRRMRVAVLVRNTSLQDDVEKRLRAVQLGTCMRPSDIQRLVRAYPSTLDNGEFCHLSISANIIFHVFADLIGLGKLLLNNN